MDLKIDGDFELVINSQKDLATVDGYELFRQELITRLTLFQRNQIGSLNEPNAIRRVRGEVYKALNESEEIQSVETVDISKTDEEEELEVYIVFNTDGTFSETI